MRGPRGEMLRTVSPHRIAGASMCYLFGNVACYA